MQVANSDYFQVKECSPNICFQRTCGCPIPESLEGQVGQGFEQPDQVESVGPQQGLELDDL